MLLLYIKEWYDFWTFYKIGKAPNGYPTLLTAFNDLMKRFYLTILFYSICLSSLWAQTSSPELQQTAQNYPDELSDTEISRRIAKGYRDYAAVIDALSNDNTNEAKRILTRSWTDVRELMQYPGVSDLARFRDLLRTILTEYEYLYDQYPTNYQPENDEIFQLRADVFADLINPEPLLDNTMMPAVRRSVNLANTTFPMDMEPPTLAAIRGLSNRKSHFQTVRTRRDIYFPMMEKIFREEGLPDELKYLAVVESALNPKAASWAAAAGLWQFIRPTGAAYGLNYSSHIDERRDPEKATRAAARHLKDLYNLFGGDWQLALAGYNCNPYRVKRWAEEYEARTGQKARFWDIIGKLPRETRNYVPMFIATYTIMNNEEQFELGGYNKGPVYAFDAVPVAGGSSLQGIADELSIGVNILKALNPELLKDNLPSVLSEDFQPDPMTTNGSPFSSAGAYLLKVPFGTGERLKNSSYFAGTEFFTIAHGVVPTEGVVVGEERFTMADLPSLVGTGRGSSRNNTTTQPTTPPPPQSYTVKEGDTLETIAQQFGVSLEDIVANNTLEGDIAVGQTLTIPSPQIQIHRVGYGDTLTNIARKYNTTVDRIKQDNNLSSGNIRIGQTLKIRK